MECVNSDDSDDNSRCSTPIPDSRPISPGPWHPENTNTPPSEGAGSVGTEGRTGEVNFLLFKIYLRRSRRLNVTLFFVGGFNGWLELG